MLNFWKNLEKPITILAPMDDVTDHVFREVMTKVPRPTVLFTEFTSIDGLASVGRERVIKKLKFSESQRPIVAQIWGTKPEHFKQAAELVQQLGFDGIDINMGCPDRNVMKCKAGAALINQYEIVTEIIKATREGAPNIPLSIKTRLDKSRELTDKWLSFLLSQDIQALTLHARTAKQLSKVPAQWDELKNLLNLRNKINPEIIIIGNGDVQNYPEALKKQKTYGVDGVMIGRGVFTNPWCFEKIPSQHTIDEKLDLLLTHAKLFVDTWGENKNFEIMKKFFKIYIRGFDGADDLRQQLMQCRTYPEIEKIIRVTMGKSEF